MVYEIQRRRLATLGAPHALVTEKIKSSNGSLSRYFGGANVYPPATIQEIDSVLTQLERLNDLAGMLPIDFSQIGRVLACLDAVEAATLKISVIQYDPPTRAKAYSIKFPNGRWFAGVRKNGEIDAGFSYQVCPMTNEVADVVLARLAEIGQTGCIKWENGMAVHLEDSIENIWPTQAEEGSCKKL